MSDDRKIADLLGETPVGPQPGFRVDVFARISLRARRRAVRRRALIHAGAFTAIGLAAPLAQWLGATPANAAPAIMALLTLAAIGLVADAVVNGPKTALARVRHLLTA